LYANRGLSRDERKRQTRWQSSEHSQDITALQYHPFIDEQLLCGSDDGIVSVFDTNIQDEMDSLIQGFNHGPIHKAGFLSEVALYALSADQKFSIYPLNSSEEDSSDMIPAASFGDLRPTAQCDYVIDVLRDIDQQYVVTGSNLRYEDRRVLAQLATMLILGNSDPHVDFIPLTASPTFVISEENVIRLQGAHGEEIVRSLYLDRSVGLDHPEPMSRANYYLSPKPS
jgi:WD repeat-containing protein 89